MAEFTSVNLRQQDTPLKDEILTGNSIFQDGTPLFLGENVQVLSKEFSGFYGVDYSFDIRDSTTTLNLIIRVLENGRGDEVIPVSHTLIAVTELIFLVVAKFKTPGQMAIRPFFLFIVQRVQGLTEIVTRRVTHEILSLLKFADLKEQDNEATAS